MLSIGEGVTKQATGYTTGKQFVNTYEHIKCVYHLTSEWINYRH